MHMNLSFNPLLNWVWANSCTMKIKFFAWMMIMDRLNAKDMIERRHWHIDDGISCVLCHLQVREERDHLFFNYFLVSVCETISRLIGLKVTVCLKLPSMLAEISTSLYLLRQCSLLAGIFGSSGMQKSLDRLILDLITGGGLSYMKCPFLPLGLSLGLRTTL